MIACHQKPLHYAAAVDQCFALPQLQLGTKPVHANFEANSCVALCLPFDGDQGILALQTDLPQAFQECALVSDHPSLHHHCDHHHC